LEPSVGGNPTVLKDSAEDILMISECTTGTGLRADAGERRPENASRLAGKTASRDLGYET
jgi:hypothetical protein